MQSIQVCSILSLAIIFSDTYLGSLRAESHLPSTRYAIDVERYRFGSSLDHTDPAFYPIPQIKITRDTYLQEVDACRPEAITKNPNRGMSGPQIFAPVLAKYVQTSDSRWGIACIAMLKAFHKEMLKQVATRKWFWQFEHPAALTSLSKTPHRRWRHDGG